MTPQSEYVFVGIGIMPVGVPQPTRKDAELFSALMKTPEGRQVLSYLQQTGPQMGTWKIFKKIGGALKAVGKITRPFTTALAKTFLPSGVVNALAKADPTTGQKLSQAMQAALPAAQQAYSAITAPGAALGPVQEPAPGILSKKNMLRNILIAGGVAVVIVGGGVLMFRRPAVQTVRGECSL